MIGRPSSDSEPARPTLVQLTSRSAPSASVDGCAAELRAQLARALGGAVPDPDHARARVAQRPDGGARRAAGTQHERRGACDLDRQRGDQRRRVGVVGGDRAALEGERVGGPDRTRTLGRRGRERERGPLVRDRNVGAAKARRRQRSHDLGQQLRRDREQLVAPVLEPGCLQRRVLDRGRAAVADRPAEHPEPRVCLIRRALRTHHLVRRYLCLQAAAGFWLPCERNCE